MERLSTSHDQLQRETRSLVTALRSPQTRGRWGELQLRRVVEMAGMIEHCDFDEQVTTDGDSGRLRPDVVVHLPGAKNVAVDAKVPLQAFLDANDADDENERRAHLAAHGRQVKAHIDGLAKKEYWKRVDPSPEFVVAFIPGDSLLSAALEQEPGLMEYAVANNVLLATPTSLIASAAGRGLRLAAGCAGRKRPRGAAAPAAISTNGSACWPTMSPAWAKGCPARSPPTTRRLDLSRVGCSSTARRMADMGVVGSAGKPSTCPPTVDTIPRALRSADLVGETLPALALVEDPVDMITEGVELDTGCPT